MAYLNHCSKTRHQHYEAKCVLDTYVLNGPLDSNCSSFKSLTLFCMEEIYCMYVTLVLVTFLTST